MTQTDSQIWFQRIFHPSDFMDISENGGWKALGNASMIVCAEMCDSRKDASDKSFARLASGFPRGISSVSSLARRAVVGGRWTAFRFSLEFCVPWQCLRIESHALHELRWPSFEG